MSRPQIPLTPASSTDIAARDKSNHGLDMEATFALPPPAVNSSITKPTTKGHAKSKSRNVQQSSPPLSPEALRTSEAKPQRKRTLSGENKPRVQLPSMASESQTSGHDLPPPPSRARKIIQMKPKQSPHLNTQEQSTSVTSSMSKQSSSTSSTATSKKAKTQPAVTTAAGRKIARKTAHSIIERRRRSKMNEEFGVLKDMIPACTGVEMHKLAILQAGIEYVRYLEGCIDKLKDRNEQLEAILGRSEADEQDGDDMEVDGGMDHGARSISRPNSTAVTDESISAGHVPQGAFQHRSPFLSHSQIPSSQVTSASNSTYTSPSLRPQSSSTSIYQSADRHGQPQTVYSILPPISTQPKTYPGATFSAPGSIPNSPLSHQSPLPPVTNRGQPSVSMTPTATPFGTLATGISPAIHAFNFSPDITRLSTYASSTPGTSISVSSASGQPLNNSKQSPQIPPLPQAALPLPSSTFRAVNSNANEKHGAAEANATAALLMMGSDRRASLSISGSKPPSESGNNPSKSSSGKGMSVKDLLSS